MKFRSRSNDEVVRLASTSGHICLIGQEFVEVPEHMISEAYASGCVSEDIYNSIKADLAKDALKGDANGAAKVTLPGGSNPPNTPPAVDKPAVIRSQVDAMLAGNEEGAFTAAGLPNLKALSSKCGFQVTKEDLEPVWAAIVAEKGQGA